MPQLDPPGSPDGDRPAPGAVSPPDGGGAQPGEDGPALGGSPDAGLEVAEIPTACLNCGATLPGRFCPACGQRAQPVRTSLARFVGQSLAEFFGLDSRVWRTLGALLFLPGRLTQAYLSGRRETYLRPLRVYLTATVLFFFLLSLIDPVGRAQDTLFQSSDATDSTTVAAHAAENDSILARGFAPLDNERADVAASRAELDSLLARSDTDPDDVAEARDDLADDLDELVRDSLGLVDRLFRIRIEQAILAQFPPDSVIVVDQLHGATRLLVPDSSAFFDAGTDEWLLRSDDARAVASAPTDAARRQALARFLRSVIGYVPTVLFVILPVFALILKVLYVRRDWHFSEHLVFGLHVHAFLFVVFIALTLVLWAASGTAPGDPRNDALKWAALGLSASVPVYLLVALRRVYAQGWVKTLWKATLLAGVYNVVLVLGLVATVMVAALLG